MTTLQPPPAPDATTAISPFSTTARQAFDVFLAGYTSRYRISRQKRANIISWLTDTQRTPVNQTEHSQRHYAVHNFRYDAGTDILWALSSEKHQGERQVVVQEEILRIIEQEHLLSKHSGRDTTWTSISKTYYGIARQEVIYLIKQCEVCCRKAANQSRGPLTPIISTELFERIQVDLIDFRHQPDAPYGPTGPKYHWVMHIKDHFSKFSQLYPLQSKGSAEVAMRMSEWIGAFGVPTIVQADNGREFKGVLKLLLLSHGVKIKNGRPRTPRTQGLVEQANGTVKEKILAWKLENGLSGWAVGLPACALAINRTVQRAIRTTPYQMVFGKEMRRYQILPVAMRERTEVEEEPTEEGPFHISDDEEQLLLDMARVMDTQSPPISNDSHNTSQQNTTEPVNDDFLDEDQQQRDQLHEMARKNQAHANKRAVKEYSKRHTIRTFSKGDHISIAIPSHDRGPTDPKRIFGKILSVDEAKPDYYEIATPYGVLDRLFPVKELLPLPTSIPLEIPAGRMRKITLAYAARQESTSTAIPVACSCKKECKSARCQCKKHKQKCSIACHKEGMDCGNLAPLVNCTEKGLIQHSNKRRRANTAGLSVHWHNEDGESEGGEDSEEDHLAELELQRAIASGGRASPLWTHEKDLVGMTQAGRNWTSRVQSNMQLRSRKLNAQEQDKDKE